MYMYICVFIVYSTFITRIHNLFDIIASEQIKISRKAIK